MIDELVLRGLSALPDVRVARQAAEALACCKGDRATFALCLLTLELALAGDEAARVELPAHVEVLVEAHRDPALASLLTAGNPALAHRWEKVRPVVSEFVSQKQGPPRAPTPRPMPRLATPLELIIDIQEIIEADPPPHLGPRRPPPPPPPGAYKPAATPPPPPRKASGAGEGVDAETRAFWKYADEALGRVPDPHSGTLPAGTLATTRAADRTRLVRFAHSVLARFPRCEPARALASLVLLCVAAQEKERGILGVNRDRLEMIRTALSLIGDPAVAGQVAVLFENDGPATRSSFAGVVELLHGYLGFCSSNGLDPVQPEAQARFCSLP